MRCRAHFQGDKCRLSFGHEGNHWSQLHTWSDGAKTDELNLPPLQRVLKDERKLLRMELEIKPRFKKMWLTALKNCQDHLKEALNVRHERSALRHQSQVESPLEGASS